MIIDILWITFLKCVWLGLFYFNQFEISLHEPKVLNNTLIDHLNSVCEIVFIPTNKRRDGKFVIVWEFGRILQFLNVHDGSVMIKFSNRNLSWVVYRNMELKIKKILV